jgi:multiple sugar transport system permease protein
MTWQTRRRWRGAGWLYLAYAVILVAFLTPVVWLFSLSIRTSSEIFVSSLRIIPHAPTLQNFVEVLRNPQFAGYLWNGLILAVVGAGGALCFAAPAAYAFSRFQFRGKRQLLFAVLSFQMISPLVIMVPLYQYMQALGLTESTFGAMLVYVAVAAPLSTWMLKGFFDGIPVELDQAAMIDGCTRFGAFFRVVAPLTVSGLTATFILTSILGWSQFVVPFILLSRPTMLPIAVGIFNFLGTYTGSATQLVAAASVLSLLPAIIIFLIFQRFIVGALTGGGVKE